VLGLDRMHAILDQLGHPERRLGTVIHVGGTNGKGSTVAMIAALLGGRGARVATYTSPHLSCLRERICFDGELISEPAIVAAADRVRAAGGDQLTFFEQLTAIACVAIADRDVDYTILEVGLGGRLDATTAIDADVAVVTGVAIDHAAILGDTLAAIAREKAGIFKPGQRVVIGAAGEPAAVSLLVDAARAVGAAAIAVVDAAAIARAPELGGYQRANAAAALAVVDQLALRRPPASPPDPAIDARVLAACRVPGRYEVIRTASGHDLILDGAHNPHAAAALASRLRDDGRRPILIVAVSADKDARGIAAALAPTARRVIATRYQQARALAPAQLADTFRAAVDADALAIETAADLAAAIGRATALATGDTAIAITGSLFVVGEARTLLVAAPSDPYVVTDPMPAP